MKLKIISLIAVISVLGFAVIRWRMTAVPPAAQDEYISEEAVEVEIIRIALDGPVASSQAEVSGMAWYGDWLVLLPQFPERVGGALYALASEDLLAFIDGGDSQPLQPQKIPLEAVGLSTLEGYEGLEAVAFHGEQVFVTVETAPAGGMLGYLVPGIIEPDLSQVVLDTAVRVELPAQASRGEYTLANYSDEALLVTPDGIITLYEANGANVNPTPVARIFSFDNLQPGGTASFPTIEYRVTDASAMDSSNNFWVINYLYPGDREKLDVSADLLGEKYGVGESHKTGEAVERLVRLAYQGDEIVFSGTPPVYLKLAADGEARNWEGLVELPGRGFLVITDRFPETILAFVPYP